MLPHRDWAAEGMACWRPTDDLEGRGPREPIRLNATQAEGLTDRRDLTSHAAPDSEAPADRCVGSRTAHPQLWPAVGPFNITNSHASESITRATGPVYQRPSLILAPFKTRVDVRIVW